MVEVSTSLLNVEKDELITMIYDLEEAKTDYFHIDIMDGKFVLNDTRELMREYSETIKQISNVPLDVHFMTENPMAYAKEYLALCPNIMTFHVEALKSKEEVLTLISFIKENNCKVGISVKPCTPISGILQYLDKVHMVLIMTVEPGLGGQGVIPETIDKVKELKKYLDDNNLEVDIEVDGGIKIETADLVKSSGANILVSGTGIVKAENKKDVIESLKKCKS